MKQWRCPTCKRRKETEDDTITVLCLCGDYYKGMDEVDNGNEE